MDTMTLIRCINYKGQSNLWFILSSKKGRSNSGEEMEHVCGTTIDHLFLLYISPFHVDSLRDISLNKVDLELLNHHKVSSLYWFYGRRNIYIVVLWLCPFTFFVNPFWFSWPCLVISIFSYYPFWTFYLILL